MTTKLRLVKPLAKPSLADELANSLERNYTIKHARSWALTLPIGSAQREVLLAFAENLEAGVHVR